jgi:hypothetical protein
MGHEPMYTKNENYTKNKLYNGDSAESGQL